MGKKSGATSVSKISASSALAADSNTSSSKKSSITKSSFAPSYLQLHLFASVIQSFESQQLRIHDATTGRLKQQHITRPGTDVTCLNWGYYGTSYRESRQSNKKKRKRAHDASEDAVVACGTSNSEIFMYSPAQGQITGTLSGSHERGIKDFQFCSNNNLEAWSLGGEGKLVQWDLTKDQAIRQISLPEPGINALASPVSWSPQILCASFTPFTLDVTSLDEVQTESFDKFKNPVHTLFRSGKQSDDQPELFLAADRDRFIHIFDVVQKRIVRTLVTGSEVERAVLFQPGMERKDVRQEQILAVITRDGTIELFSQPFVQPTYVNGDIKTKRKNITRKANASIRLVPQDASKRTIPIFDISFQGPDLVVVSVEGGVEPAFQKLRWQDEGSHELLFEGLKEIVAIRDTTSLNSVKMNGAKDMGNMKVDESRAVVANGLAEPQQQVDAIEISSSEEKSDEEESKADDNPEKENSESASDVEMDDVDEDEGAPGQAEDQDQNDENLAQEELSFGELLAAKHPNTISITEGLISDDKQLATIPTAQTNVLASGMSLGTVLSQSLRTNDQSLLETCLHASDEGIIQNTILRLESSLAAILLTKLAERLADRPGRWGHLLTWVQYTMIAHGGAIAAQPAVATKLRTLYQVLTERSKVLPNMLLLKGKLDMMNAQQAFREQAEAQRNTSRANRDEPAMIYIEGEDDDWSSDSDLDDDDGRKQRKKPKSKKSRKALEDLIGEDESSDEENRIVANGISDSESDEEDSESDEDIDTQEPGGVVDDEAEVSGEEDEYDGSDSGEEDDSNDDDEEEEDSSMEDFINDDSVSEIDEQDDIDIENEEPEPAKPATKRSKHKHR